MCVGETGMGKTTLIESLFNMKLDFPPCNNELKTVNLLSKSYGKIPRLYLISNFKKK